LCRQKKSGTPPVSPQALTNVWNILGCDLGIVAHEPETARMKIAKRLLRQRQFVRLGRFRLVFLFNARAHVPIITVPFQAGKIR
jgi:hypothetical protein